MVMLVLSLGRTKIRVKKSVMPTLRIALGFFFYCLLVYLFEYQSAAYFLWGFRNIFRFYIAFFVFIAYLDEGDVEAWFKIMDILFWVNAGLSLLQFFLLGIKGDFLGGIFGIQGASNGFTLCLMTVVIGRSLLETFEGKESFLKSMLKCTASIMVAAMAEMKFYYFVFIFLLLGAAALTNFSVKKMAYVVLAVAAIIVGAMLLVEWFGFQGFLSLEGLWESATKNNYSSQGDINRLSAIPTLSRRLAMNPAQQLFGFGLGNCDASAFPVCNTPFFQRYGHLHYTWFASAMLFLETGILGLVLYISFFVVCFAQAYKSYKSKTGNRRYSQLSVLVSVLCLVLTAYNSSLRIEAGYMMYFILALPFIHNK